MNNIFTKIVLTSLLIIIGNYGMAQQKFEGTAYYFSKTDVDMSNFSRPDMSEEQKKRREERMKSMFEKTYLLDFNKTESIFKVEEKLAAPTQQGGGGRGARFGAIISGAVDGDKYKNSETNELLISNELLGKKFLVKDELPKLDWKTTGEVKQIGQYMCFKATAIKTWTDFDVSNFRRPPPRGDEKPEEEEKEKEEAPTETLVTAWYTLQIPVSHGPANYWGLPGLILEIHEDDTIILCSKIVINAKDKTEIKKPTKGKKVSLEEYNEIAVKKFQEMRENFRSRRGGDNNRGRR